jgi:hypothetical protein
MARRGGHQDSVAARRLWPIAILATAGVLGTASEAGAGLYYWSEFDPGYYRSLPPFAPPPRPRIRRHQAKKIVLSEKETAKPQGPLIIAISIERQSLKIYDANGFYAETPISTGMQGHPTPMGVFSVIQKHKFHHSNIYSGAPMPYMQRITWSGVAIHAGVLPGYPASHGCIRMPMPFAVKMWNWTRVGARVVVTPGEMIPANFSHPLLPTHLVVPQPTASGEPPPDAPAAAKTADADASKARDSETKLELRASVGHDDGAKPATKQTSASNPQRKQTDTADASEIPAAKPAATMSDAPASGSSPPREPSNAEAKSEHAKPEAEPAGVKHSETAAADDGASILASKDDARSPDAEKAAVSKPDPAAVPKRSGQISVLISRKDSRLYARQNLAPLFEVPITIAPSDRPLGTHVFTARIDKQDGNLVHWSVVSLPVPARYAERHSEDERLFRRRKIVGAVEVKAMPLPDSPAEALDRLTVPGDTMARMIEAFSTGSSIVVSDQGVIAGETGEGTDFIVSLR